MRILVHAEHEAGAVRDTAFELVAIARALGGEIEALVMGSEPEALAGQLGGADRVIAVADPALEAYLPDAHAAAMQFAIRERRPDLVLLSYGTAGLDIAPPTAHACRLPLICNAVALRLEETALAIRAQIYGGKLEASARVPLPAIVMAMPGAARAEEGRLDGTPPVETLSMPQGAAAGIRLVETLEPEAGGVDLTQAERIVCVGRAIGGTDKITVVEELAALLDAEIAGSRPVIDAGWLSKDRQVGKSGTTVKPRLYLMAGVSGAPEHLEGMSDSELIVAINTDERAPIFAKAHYGAVCDMFDVLPKLAARLKDS